MDYLTKEEVDRQQLKFYATLAAWPLFLWCLPYAWARFGAWSLAIMVFPGLYLFTGVGYCMHECWHKYVPVLPNDTLFDLFGWMLLTDPQVYRILHGRHHADVNSWEDHEFHPLGNIQKVPWRRLYNSLEILFGVVFVVVVSALVVPRRPLYRAKYRRGRQWSSLAVWVVFLTGVGFASGVMFGVSAQQVIVAYALMYGLGSFFLHQSQLVEHGNLIVDGEWSQRNLKTRNLRRRTLLEKAFLFLTHNDSREHVLHHTLVRVYSRPFPGRVPLPPQAVVISLREYLGILGDMLLGRSSRK